MLSEELNKMLRKILLLVSSYDKKFFAWLEGKDSRIKSSNPRRKGSPVKGSVKSRSSVEDASNKVQVSIPDPWDDPLM